MPGDAVLAHQIDKIPLGVARQRRFAEVRIGAEVSGWLNVEVGKIAAPAAGHQDFAPRFFAVIQH